MAGQHLRPVERLAIVEKLLKGANPKPIADENEVTVAALSKMMGKWKKLIQLKRYFGLAD